MKMYDRIEQAPDRSEFLTDLIDGLGEWSDRLCQGYADDESDGRFGQDRWAAIREAGLTGLSIAEEHGGLGLDIADVTELMTYLGEICTDGGLGFSLATHICGVSVPLERFGSADLRSRYLPQLAEGALIGAHAISEPHSGSDAFAMKTTAVQDGDDWVLNGEKCFISNGPIADLIAVYTCTNHNKGALGGFSVFLVEKDAAGLTIGAPRKKMGLRTAPMADLYLTDVRVPGDMMLGREGQAYAIMDYVMKWEVLAVFALQVGEMRRRLADCIRYAKERQQFGEKICKFQAVSHRLVDMHLRTEMAGDVLARATHAMRTGQKASLCVAAAKLQISELNVQTALDAITIHGGSGYMTETGVEVGLRDAVGGLIYSGTNDTQRNRIAAMLGL